jgi:hypothetical protein
MKVTLNSLSKLAWLLSFLRHACSGGAPPSKSNCREPNRARPYQPRVPPEQYKREPKNSPPIVAGTHEMGSPAAARSGRRNPPPATSASGSGSYCRSPSPPNSRCGEVCSFPPPPPPPTHEMLINPCSSPQGRSRSEARSTRMKRMRELGNWRV